MFASAVLRRYEPLPQARSLAGSSDAKALLAADVYAEILGVITAASAACERALAKAGKALTQRVVEQNARLQQMMGNGAGGQWFLSGETRLLNGKLPVCLYLY